MRSEVAQQPRVEECGDGGAVADLVGLPWVERQRGALRGQFEAGAGQPGGETGGGDGPAALRPGGVGGEYGPVDGHPVQGEGAAQFG